MKRTCIWICLTVILSFEVTSCHNTDEINDAALIKTLTEKTQSMNSPTSASQPFDTVVKVEEIIRNSSNEGVDTVYGKTAITYNGNPVYVLWAPGMRSYIMKGDDVHIISVIERGGVSYGTTWARVISPQQLARVETAEETNETVAEINQ